MQLHQQTTLSQRLQLSQTQIQSLSILAMDNVSLNAFLQNEFLENPMLDYTPKNDMPVDFNSYPSWMERTGRQSGGTQRIFTQEEDWRREFAAENEDSLKEYLLSQLNMNSYTKDEWSLMKYMIDCLDDNGFFTMAPEEAACRSHLPVKTVVKCLEHLRQLEPFGIFAGSLSDCLLRQLDVKGMEDVNLKTIIQSFLPEVAEGKISMISRELNISTAQTRTYIALIQTLNPRPLQGLYRAQSAYIVPDIIFSHQDGAWEIRLNERWMGSCSLNAYYVHMMQASDDPDLCQYFKKSAERARFLLNSLNQRRHTLLSISRAILDYQKDYFTGSAPLKPMTLNHVAHTLGVNVSTVSRGIRDKYIQYPGGTILMKQLFSARVSPSSPALTAQLIKDNIRNLIQQEEPRHPYSDQQLVRLLNQMDIHISRRTVTKYREELGIRKSLERKDF